MLINDRIIIPTLSIQDQSLHPTDRQVLHALCVFADPQSHVVTADRKTIGSFVGLHESKVSSATARLESAGWVLKEGKGRGVKYYINWCNKPESLPDSARVQTVATVTSVPGSGRDETNETDTTLPDSARDTSQNKKQGTTIRTDQKIRSDSDDLIINNLIFREVERHDVITFQQAVNILEQAGCQYSIKQTDNNHNTKEIDNWISSGVTVELLIAAAKHGRDAETRQAPLGPRYVSGCIQTVKAQKAKPQKIYIPPASAEKELEKMAAEYGVGTKGVQSYQALRGLVEDAVRRHEAKQAAA